MNNTIPFNPTANRTVRTEQITVDVNILSVLKHATSPGMTWQMTMCISPPSARTWN